MARQEKWLVGALILVLVVGGGVLSAGLEGHKPVLPHPGKPVAKPFAPAPAAQTVKPALVSGASREKTKAVVVRPGAAVDKSQIPAAVLTSGGLKPVIPRPRDQSGKAASSGRAAARKPVFLHPGGDVPK